MILSKAVKLDILDIGCATGRHARYLAQLGHTVIGLELTDEIKDAKRFADETGVSTRNYYIQGDARALMFRKPFDAVLNTEMLHQISKTQSRKVLAESADLVKPGGYHVVSGYMIDHGVVNALSHMRCLQPGELLAAYNPSEWDVLEYTEEMKTSYQYNNQDMLQSRAMIVAQKRPIPTLF